MRLLYLASVLLALLVLGGCTEGTDWQPVDPSKAVVSADGRCLDLRFETGVGDITKVRVTELDDRVIIDLRVRYPSDKARILMAISSSKAVRLKAPLGDRTIRAKSGATVRVERPGDSPSGKPPVGYPACGSPSKS
ncbi:hypothetical protein GCM10010191_26620 [Actinomadura vinacea]|uniref:Uncharacterized protein n=1 Tax=Actinomadura vinacea TaxID=115336 RepID=A0ABN3IVH4_9ACTN